MADDERVETIKTSDGAPFCGISNKDDLDGPTLAWGVPSKVEPRWPASLAIVFAMAVYIFLPGQYTVGPNWLMPALELAILVPVSLSAPRRVHGESYLLQVLAMAMIALVTMANCAALLLLIERVVHFAEISGAELLYSSISIWITNVIVFSLWYWEIDRGGPDQRAHAIHRNPDFLFPQMTTPGCAAADWTPQFSDYLYVAFTNATAFSPTDSMPLTGKAKLLMAAQSVISLGTIIITSARAVNILQ